MPPDVGLNFDTYRILQEVDNGTFMYAKHDADASGPPFTYLLIYLLQLGELC